MNDVLKSHLIELNDLAVMMFRHLHDVMQSEPPIATEGYPRHEAEEMATNHYEWARQRDAVRILLGIQLVNLGLDQLEHPLEGAPDDPDH